MRALIIEPQSLVALSIEDALRDVGFLLFAHAATEDEALAEAEFRCPDLIISNVRIMDGCALKAVETICEGKRIPVIFLAETPSDVPTLPPRAVVLRKPFPVHALGEAVMQVRAG